MILVLIFIVYYIFVLGEGKTFVKKRLTNISLRPIATKYYRKLPTGQENDHIETHLLPPIYSSDTKIIFTIQSSYLFLFIIYIRLKESIFYHN